MFHLHMAGLAQSYEVRNVICLFGCIEIAKGPDVMDGQTLTFMNTAGGAFSSLLLNHFKATNLPPAPSVGLWPSNPVRRILFGQVFRSVFPPTLCRAKNASPPAPSKLPRFALKVPPAVFAHQLDGFNKPRIIPTAHRPRLKRRFVRFGTGFQALGVVMTQAAFRTKAGAANFIGPDDEFLAAVLTCKFNSHVNIVPPFMGSGTTGAACVALHREFVGIELDPAYHAIAQRRVQNAQPALLGAL